MVPLIFEKYPQLANKIKWLSIVNSPTPLQELKNISTYFKLSNLWIKRDDISAIPYGGNKPRKLEFVLPDVVANKCKIIITTGGIGSNHCLATTIYAKRENIKTMLMLFPQQITEHVIKTLSYFHKLGAEIHLFKSMQSAFFNAIYEHKISSIEGKKTYFLYPGGSSVLGCLGFVNAIFELKQQIDDGIMEEPDYIFVTVGTCGTLAGMLVGAELCGLKSKIIGVRVVDWLFSNEVSVFLLATKVLNFIKKNVGALNNKKLDFNKIKVFHSYYGGEYGKPTKQGEEMQTLLKELENIKLDLTYTAKTFSAFIDFAKRRKNRRKIFLFWHTFNNNDLESYFV